MFANIIYEYKCEMYNQNARIESFLPLNIEQAESVYTEEAVLGPTSVVNPNNTGSKEFF
jgi:hypothetical protein